MQWKIDITHTSQSQAAKHELLSALALHLAELLPDVGKEERNGDFVDAAR